MQVVSHVSSMIVTCALIESDADGGLSQLHAWSSRLDRPIRFGVLDDEPAVCNAKGMQAHILGAAGNYFDEDALLAAFPTFAWLFPDEALLVVYPENGAPRVVRGDGRQLD